MKCVSNRFDRCAKSAFVRLFACLAVQVLCLAAPTVSRAADVNVLVVGCETDFFYYKAFSGSNVVTQLRGILEGAGLGTVNVVYEDRKYQNDWGNIRETELFQWFYGPYPAGVERSTRWPNLRGAAGTPWDYVVLIGDGYSMEEFPGFYAAGVASVAGEVAKGTAEPILLMTWPYTGSTSSVAHYEEVTYRVGNSGGYKVAPAGLAWQAAGSPKTTNQHPNSDAAYIAAATLFSTIWNKSATNSTYNPKSTLAQTAYNTFTNSLVAQHYTGKFISSSTNALGFYDYHPRRIVCDGIDSSSENAVKSGFGEAMKLAGCTDSTLLGTKTVNTQRYTYSGGGSRIVYAMEIQTVDTVSGGQDEFCSTIVYDLYGTDSSQHNNYRNNTDVARWLPFRMLYARIAQRYPKSEPFYANHKARHINSAMGSFGVTQLGGGGRSPMKAPEQVASEFDYCFQVGYELAWQFRHLQVRAPGFRFIPDSLTVGFTTPEVIRVKFYLRPHSNVTVTVTSAGPVTLENATLTFTPENYNVTQEVRVLATPEAVPGSTFAVECITSSGDEVYDGIHDAWDYKVNRLPTSANIAVDAFEGKITPITLKGTDPEREAITYQIVDPPKYGTLTVVGPVAVYTPDEGFTGSDSFTYKCNDSGDDSNVATVTITVMPQSFYNFNLVRNPGAELDPLADYGWVSDCWSRVAGGTEGSYNFAGGISLYQIVDISRYAERIARGDQYFSFSADLCCDGYVDRVGFTVECLNAAGKAVQTNSVSQLASFSYAPFSGTFLAPTNTASIRVTVKGWTSTGGGARVRADRLNLTALKPQNIAPVAYSQTGLVASAGIPNPVTLTSWDIDRDDLVYIIVNPPSHGTISGGAGAARFYTPDAGYEGPDSLTFKVFDREFNSNIATVSFDVVLNQSPRIVLDSPRTNSVQVPQNVDLLLRTTVWDDGLPNPLQCTWSVVDGPTNGVFTNPSEPVTGVNLMNGASGGGVYRLTVYDGAVTVTQDIEVAVGYDTNRNIGAFVFRQESYAGTPMVPFVMNGAYASDDGKPITPGAFTYEFVKVSGTGNVVFADATVSEPTLTFDRAGSYVVRMIVNDGEVEDYNDIPVTITSVENLAPVADAVLLSPASPMPGDTVTISGAGSFDPNLDPITFSWVQTAGTGVTLSASNVMEPTFEVPDRGAYTFDLTVSDGEFSSTTSVVVNVLNAPPVVDAGEHQTVYRVPGTLPWTPVNLTLAAWYDAGDTNTITASLGAVSQWRDKSASGRTLNQATSGARPKTGTRTIGGLNAIEFDGTDDVLTAAANKTDAITIFGVVLADSGSGTDSLRSWLSAPAGDNPDYQMTAPANADTLGTTIRDTAGNAHSGSRTASRNNAHIHAAYSWIPGGAAGGVRVDGGAPASIATSTSGLAKYASELAIGRQKPGYTTRFHDGLVGEVIIINRRLAETDNDFLKIEGYLAHKWNLAGNLPAGHPFKNVAPVTNAIIAIVSLDGTVSDPDPEDTVTSKWSVAGGNFRTVFFGDAAALDTTATFAQDGSYVLRLTADDGGSRPYDEVTISVYDAAPHVTAGEATGITDTRALLGGTLMRTGAAPVTVWCYWNPDSDPGANPAGWLHSRSLGVVGANSTLVNDTSATAALTPRTVYFYRYAAVNMYGTNWSDAASFLTHSPPLVENSGGDAGAGSSATLKGVLAGGLNADAWICWGTSDGGTTSTGSWQHVVSAGAVTEGENFSVLVTGLSTNTIYFYRSYAQNAYGTGWSSVAGSFSGEPSAGNPWTPAKSTTAAWYDAADASTITSSSGAVSQWRDKSASVRNLNQATTTSQPRTGTRTINGLNAIEFDGSNDALTGAANKPSAITLFGVVQVDSGSGTDGARSWLSAPGGSNPDYWMQAPAHTNTLGASFIGVSGVSAAAARNSAHIHAAYSWVTNGENGAVRIDGGAVSAPIYATTNNLQKLATELAIGRQKNVTGRFHDGLIGEVIIINRRLTEADDEFLKFEGYLAHKWGMTANLPDGHPYKKLTPWQGAIANLPPTGISELGATFNAGLAVPGTNYTVSVYYGTTDGGTNAGAWASSATVGTWSNVTTTISHSVGRLIPGQTYYCTFMASNAAGAVWASPSWQFWVPNGYDVCPLTVSTAHGTAVPAGETSQRSNSVVNVSIIDSPVYSGATQYVCTGWTGTGSATSGSGTNTSFTITTDTTVTWTWATNTLPTHTVVFDPGANGSRTGGGALTQQVIHGFAAVAPVITPATGYTFEGFDNTFTNVTGNLTINAQYALIPYTVSYLAGPNGSLSGTAIQTVLHGTSSTAVTAVPAAGYHFVTWSDGSTQNPRTDSGVTNDITVTASFALNPVVSTGAGALPMSTTTALLRGVLTTGATANAWICWGTADGGVGSTSAWERVVSVGAVTEGVAFSNLVTGLSTNSTYFYRCYAANVYDSDWSDVVVAFSGTPAPNGGSWTPSGNITMGAWYDATDAATLRLNASGGVTNWLDKSGHANQNLSTYTWATKFAQTGGSINGKNSVQFTNDYQYLNMKTALTTVRSMFFVANKLNGSTEDSKIAPIIGQTYSYGHHTFVRNNDTAYSISIDGDVTNTGLASVSGNAPTNAGPLVGRDINLGLSNTAKNGALQWYTQYDKSQNVYYLGRTYTKTYYTYGLRGDLGEVILLPAVPSVADRQKIEGYLAWKWSLVANMPAGHPYKTIPPGAVSQIANLVPTGVSHLAATFNAELVAASTNYAVTVYYGTTDGGTNAGNWASSAYVGTWTNVLKSISTTANGLTGGQTYYYTFMASNATSRLWAKPSWKFVMPDTCLLTVNSDHGTAVPAGVTEQLSNAVVNVSLSGTPLRVGTTQYVCTGWVRTGSAPASGSGLSTSFAMNQDTTVTWTWATNILPVYTVVFDEGEHGSRTGGGVLTQEVIHGLAAIAPTITPAYGYQFEGWDTSFDPVTGNLTVHAQYALIQYTVRYLAGIHGSISGPATQIVPHGLSSTEVTAEPDAGGYHFVAWSDGYTQETRSDSNVTSNITLTAFFEFNEPPVLAYGAGSTPVTESSAVLRGVLTSGNSGQAWICWGAADGGTTSTGDWDNVVSVGAVIEGVAFSNLVTGLSTNNTYFYRCYAENVYGSDWSDTAATFGGTPVESGIGEPWTPTGNITMAAWYDASVTGTITAVSGAVSQWRDKSTAGRTLNQTTSGARPKTGTRTIGGLNAIEFDGSDDALTAAANRTDAITIFGVVQVDSGSGTDSLRSWLSSPGGSNPDYQMQAPANVDILGATIRDSAGTGYSGSRTASRNNAHIHAAYSWIPGGAVGGARIDGGAPASITASANTLQKYATELAIGRQKTGFARFHDGLVGEVIIINRRLTETDDDFLRIEGYLAHKWNLAGNLPTNHPYKVSAPSVSAIANRVATGISESAATFNAALNALSTNRDVVVYYGTTDGGTNAGSWESSAMIGSWTNVVSTNISYAVSSLLGGTTYYYTFMASNEAGVVWASPSWTFTTPGIPGANRAPVAHAQSVITLKDTAKAITLTGSDANNDPLTYTVVTQPAHGTLSGTAPSLIYTPAANYNGADSFTFKVNDGTIDSATATVSITVTVPNDAPVADAQSVTTAEDTAQAITMTGSDADNNPLTYTVVTQPAHGTLSGTAPNVTYTPAANYNGADSFTFKVNDGIVDSDVATVSITVTAVNDAPVANAQSVTTAEETAKAITLTGSDVEGSTLTYTIVTQPAHGTLSGTEQNMTYTPAANYSGADSFTFKVNDGEFDSAVATVSITVTAVNDAPVAHAGDDQTVALNGTSSIPWTPTNITLAAWYDASDTNTITLVGSKVSAWATKAGSTRTLVQTTDANRPLYVDNSYIQFDGVNDILTATGFNSTPNITVFSVSMTYSNAVVADANKALLCNWDGSTGNPDWWLHNRTHEDTQGTTVSAGAGNPTVASAATRDITHIRAFTSLTATLNGLNRIDGGTAQGELVANGSAMQNGTGRTLFLGRQKAVSTRFFQGRCQEIIIVTSRMLPTDASGDYLKLEGYLAHKWGMAANLPSDHPYKNAAPVNGTVATAVATLSGSASDPDSDPLTTTWSVVSTVPAGLAAPTFGNAAATNTTATFTQAGQYTLRLTANDGTVAVSNEVVITVTDGASQSHVLTVTAGANGTITPNGSVTVADGASQAFTIAPASHYAIDSVRTNGSNVTIANPAGFIYTWNNVRAAGTLDASFVRAKTIIKAVPTEWLATAVPASTNDYEAAVVADPDGDGFTTAEEYWSGTDPVNSNSFLRIDSVTLEGGNAVLKWQHARVDAGLPALTIQTTTNLQFGTWVYTGQKSPVNGTNTWSGVALPQQLFYRLAVTNAP